MQLNGYICEIIFSKIVTPVDDYSSTCKNVSKKKKEGKTKKN
jgi:hypothetical protein